MNTQLARILITNTPTMYAAGFILLLSAALLVIAVCTQGEQRG